jgi:hypothetical protein
MFMQQDLEDFPMDEQIYKLIDLLRAEIAEREWQIRQLQLSNSLFNTDGDIVSWADLEI